MNIGINISPLKGGHQFRGTGSYTKLLLEALLQYHPEHSYLEFSEISELPPTIDCIHYPFFDPFFLTLPAQFPKPLVITVHDLIPLAYKEHFPSGIRGTVKWYIQRSRLLQSAKIITDSQASKEDIRTILRLPPDRIAVIPLAAAAQFQPVTQKYILEHVQQKYHLPPEFLLYVGDVNWNKNIPNLLQAIHSIKIPLVLVGKAFLNEEIPEVQSINRLIQKEELHDKIIKLGFVPDEDLPTLYTLARLTLCVSFAEGFGFPVLESMACGTPCVVSNRSSLNEIAGPATLVNPDTVAMITQGIERALQTDKKKQRDEVISWAKQYSWKKVASDTVTVYKSVL